MSLSLAHNDNQLVVGSSRGRMALVDLRKKLLVHVFKGFAGSIRSVKCHPTLPLVASCGLDRFLRIHDLNRHKLLKKVSYEVLCKPFWTSIFICLRCLFFFSAIIKQIQIGLCTNKTRFFA